MLIVLSLFTVALFLAGHAATSTREWNRPSLDAAALGCAAGILLDYTLVLCGLQLTHVLVAIGLLGTWGLVKGARGWSAAGRTRSVQPAAWWTCLPIAYILGLYYVAILSEAIFRWDARVIWFFHAKMIWVEGALRRHTGFDHPSLAFSGPSYPELVPAIAAQLAWARGFWNEFLPKASLVVMLVPPVLWAFSFHRRLVGSILLVLFAFFSLDGWLASGLMDPYLALYLGMALMLFGRYLAEGRTTDLLSTVCALGIIMGLKSEGLLVVISFVASLLVTGLSSSGPTLVLEEAKRLGSDPVFRRILLLAATPTLLWTALKHAWGLRDAMTADLSVNAARLVERVSDLPTLKTIFLFLVTRATALWALASLFLVAVVVQSARHRRVPRAAVVAALTSLVYFCAMYFVYLVTPTDLIWHLTLSGGRTMFPVSAALLVALYLVVSDAPSEAPSAATERQPTRGA